MSFMQKSFFGCRNYFLRAPCGLSYHWPSWGRPGHFPSGHFGETMTAAHLRLQAFSRIPFYVNKPFSTKPRLFSLFEASFTRDG